MYKLIYIKVGMIPTVREGALQLCSSAPFPLSQTCKPLAYMDDWQPANRGTKGKPPVPLCKTTYITVRGIRGYEPPSLL